jgi:microcystin-dependent protein
MGQPFVGEIRMFAGNFPPNGWQFCQGQLIAISENETLFNLIGTTYGGDGQSTFGLPDLASRIPIHMGQGPTITQNYQIGEKTGSETVTLTTPTMPQHTHSALTATTGQVSGAAGAILADAQTAQVGPRTYSTLAGNANMNANTISIQGGSQPHDNMQPYLAINYIISLFGVFPTQN